MSDGDAFIIVSQHFGRLVFYTLPLLFFWEWHKGIFVTGDIAFLGAILYIVMVVHCWGVLV